MPETTSRLALPMLASGQARKEITHNEALLLLDLLVHGAVSGIDQAAPPATPGVGQCWVLSAAPEGDWAGHGRELAGWTEGGWRFVQPREGMRLWVGDGAGFVQFSNGEWRVGEVHGRLIVEGKQVVGPRSAAIVEPSGGTVVDAPARTALAAVLSAMRVHGLIAE